MIVYLDSSVISRALLSDETGHPSARSLLESDHALVTGSWSRVEVSAALARASRAGRGDGDALFERLDALTDPRSGQVTVVDVEQAEVELLAVALVRRTGIRSLDAWHVGCAHLLRESLGERSGPVAFATRDSAQGVVAHELGFTLV